jgi:hypothetical protein
MKRIILGRSRGTSVGAVVLVASNVAVTSTVLTSSKPAVLVGEFSLSVGCKSGLTALQPEDIKTKHIITNSFFIYLLVYQ